MFIATQMISILPTGRTVFQAPIVSKAATYFVLNTLFHTTYTHIEFHSVDQSIPEGHNTQCECHL
jgi:hypothetical protein